MEQPANSQSRLYKLFNKENNIGDSGCKFITMAKWYNLLKLFLGNYYLIGDCNNIGEKGCRHLAKAKWEQLKKLSLGSHYLIEILTKSAAKAADI